MTDKETGEVLWQRSTSLACNFVKNDTGRTLLANMIDSAIKGVRSSEHKIINCSIDLTEPQSVPQMELPFF